MGLNSVVYDDLDAVRIDGISRKFDYERESKNGYRSMNCKGLDTIGSAAFIFTT